MYKMLTCNFTMQNLYVIIIWVLSIDLKCFCRCCCCCFNNCVLDLGLGLKKQCALHSEREVIRDTTHALVNAASVTHNAPRREVNMVSGALNEQNKNTSGEMGRV